MGILTNLSIAVTGTLPSSTPQLKKWIEANSGRYTPHVNKETTHLITGADAWKNATDAVQAAVAAGAFVVSYDWLEDSLQRKRRLAEGRYTWEHLWKERKKRKVVKRLGTRSDALVFERGCVEARRVTGTGTSTSKARTAARKPRASTSFFFKDVADTGFVSAAADLKRRREEREAAKAARAEAAKRNEASRSPPSPSPHTLTTTRPATAEPKAKPPALKDLYHYYLDTTGFEYKILLTRCDLRASQISRYRLSVLESHAKPNVYCVFVEYLPPGTGVGAVGEEECGRALRDWDESFSDRGGEVKMHGPSTDDGEETTTHTHSSSSQEDQATHLSPSPAAPYKSLLTPLNTPFATAWRVFRHTFRDLTLLAWEERFDTSKELYKARATRFGTEPFVYVRPKVGMPLGLRVQEMGLFLDPVVADGSDSDALVGGGGADDGLLGDQHEDLYTPNAHSLPALTLPLGSGIIGAAVQRHLDFAREQAEKAERRAAVAETERLRGLGLGQVVGQEKKRKPDFSRPLFNEVRGRPLTDAWGRYSRAGGAGRGRGGDSGL